MQQHDEQASNLTLSMGVNIPEKIMNKYKDEKRVQATLDIAEGKGITVNITMGRDDVVFGCTFDNLTYRSCIFVP